MRRWWNWNSYLAGMASGIFLALVLISYATNPTAWAF